MYKMKQTGIFYGSTTGVTEEVAGRIAKALGVEDAHVHNISDLTAEMLDGYEVLVLGSSTWGAGDLQDDWYAALDMMKLLDLSQKTVALFGCGDSGSFSDTFCDAIGTLYQSLQQTGCHFVPGVDAGEYCYDSSSAVVDGKFVGLALDEVNEPDKTDGRIAGWVELLRPYLQ